MIKYILYFLCISLIPCQAYNSNNKNLPIRTVCTLVDEYHLGAWALEQHNDMCGRVYQAINSGKLKSYSADNILLTKEKAIKMLQVEVVGFLSTDPDDPTIGHDTEFLDPMIDNYHEFTLTEKHITLTPVKGGMSLTFNKKEFMTILTAENKVYFEHYTKNNAVRYSSIPAMSEELMTSLNNRLFKKSLEKETKVFISDSMITKYSSSQIEQRSREEVVAFVSTSADDPSEGRDTIYTQGMDVGDTSQTQGLYFALHQSELKLKLNGISSVFHPTISRIKMNVMVPFGFLEYKTANQVIAKEKEMLEYALAFAIKDKLDPFPGYAYENYMEMFGIPAKKE
jgi:hypothetical protein